MIRTGHSRWVFIIGRLALKTPSMSGWRSFLLGLLANMQERDFSKIPDMKAKLCPVYFSLPLGFLIVMPKADVLQDGAINSDDLQKFCVCNENYTIPAELKADSFGYIKGKLVAIDFG